MMKAQWSSDTLGSVYSMTQHNIPEDLSLQQHHCGDPKLTVSTGKTMGLCNSANYEEALQRMK